MTIKLPIILSAMILALAPTALASEADAPPAAATEAKGEAMAKEGDAMAKEGDVMAKEGKGVAKRAKKRVKKAEAAEDGAAPVKHHRKHHGRHHGRHHGGYGHDHAARDSDAPWDYWQSSSTSYTESSTNCSGETVTTTTEGGTLPPEVPGQRGPYVPRG